MKRILNLLPLLAPFPEGYAVYASLAAADKLGWPPIVAGLAALVVALVGFFALQVRGMMAEFNHSLKPSEAEFTADLKAPHIAIAIWFVGSTALILFLEIAIVKSLAPVALVIVGGSGSYIGSLFYAQEARAVKLGEHRAAKARARADAREENKTHNAGGSGIVRRGGKRSASDVRSECTALAAQYACTHPQCGWTPSVDALIASVQNGKSAKTSAASAKAGHVKNKHPKVITAENTVFAPNQK